MNKVELVLDKLAKDKDALLTSDINPLAVVKRVEEAGRQIKVISGMEKRDSAVRWLDKNIKLRFIPKWLRRLIFGRIVDQTVEKLNGQYPSREW